MNRSRSKSYSFLLTAVLSLSALTACDSPSGLEVSRNEAGLTPIKVNLIAGANAQQVASVQITDPSQLPAELLQARDLVVVFDNSQTSVSVLRNADGSLSFPLSTSRSFDSNARLKVLMIGDRKSSYPLELITGSPFQLASPAISVLPANTLPLGSRLSLKANLQDSQVGRYRFSWEVAPSAAGPWQALAGEQAQIEWEPTQAGSYYVRMNITDLESKTVSTYLSPTPQVYIQAVTELAKTDPASGVILAGDTVKLDLNLTGLDKLAADSGIQWFYGSSAQAPFQPIAQTGRTIKWEPPGPGSYLLRVQINQAGRLSTYTSSQPEVVVNAPDDIFATQPLDGSVIRGESIRLSASIPNPLPETQYSWFYSGNPQAPFQPISEAGQSIDWRPELTGDFFLRVRTFEPSTQTSRSYTSNQSLVSVRDSNAIFSTLPSPATVARGESLTIALNQNGSENVNWSFSASAQGPYQAIPGSGRNLRWTPLDAGSFYLRATETRADGSTAAYTSSDPLVFVNERSEVLQTEPDSGRIKWGQPIRLKSTLQISNANLRYDWSYSSSAQGPFQPAQTLESNAKSAVTWYPPQPGSYFVRLAVSNAQSQSQTTFTSAQPVVQVENRPLFTTQPASGRIKNTDNIRLFTAFDPASRNFNLGWSYSRSTAGPFIPIGGSILPEINWDAPLKPNGSYYIRLQATSAGAERSLSFVSSVPIVFISNSDTPGNEFGTP